MYLQVSIQQKTSETGENISIEVWGWWYQNVEKQVQYVCSKAGDEGSIYAARQGMRTCNNTNMHNPSLHLFYYEANSLRLSSIQGPWTF